MFIGESVARQALSTWEKAASQASEAFVRDLRTLELGAQLLQSQLAWKRATDTFVAGMMAHSYAMFSKLGKA